MYPFIVSPEASIIKEAVIPRYHKVHPSHNCLSCISHSNNYIKSLPEHGKLLLTVRMAPFVKNFEKTRDKLGERLRQLTVFLSEPLQDKEREHIIKELQRSVKIMDKIQDRGQKRKKKVNSDCFQLRCEAIKTLLRQEADKIRDKFYNSFHTAIVVQSFALHIGSLVIENNFPDAHGWAELVFHNLFCHDGLWELEWVMPKSDPRRKEVLRSHDLAWEVRHPRSSKDCEGRCHVHQLWRGLASTVPTCKCFQCSKLRDQRAYPTIDLFTQNKFRAL